MHIPLHDRIAYRQAKNTILIAFVAWHDPYDSNWI